MKAPALLRGDSRINVWQSNAALFRWCAGALVCRSHSTARGLGGRGQRPSRYSTAECADMPRKPSGHQFRSWRRQPSLHTLRIEPSSSASHNSSTLSPWASSATQATADHEPRSPQVVRRRSLDPKLRDEAAKFAICCHGCSAVVAVAAPHNAGLRPMAAQALGHMLDNDAHLAALCFGRVVPIPRRTGRPAGGTKRMVSRACLQQSAPTGPWRHLKPFWVRL